MTQKVTVDALGALLKARTNDLHRVTAGTYGPQRTSAGRADGSESEEVTGWN